MSNTNIIRLYNTITKDVTTEATLHCNKFNDYHIELNNDDKEYILQVFLDDNIYHLASRYRKYTKDDEMSKKRLLNKLTKNL